MRIGAGAADDVTRADHAPLPSSVWPAAVDSSDPDGVGRPAETDPSGRDVGRLSADLLALLLDEFARSGLDPIGTKALRAAVGAAARPLFAELPGGRPAIEAAEDETWERLRARFATPDPAAAPIEDCVAYVHIVAESVRREFVRREPVRREPPPPEPVASPKRESAASPTPRSPGLAAGPPPGPPESLLVKPVAGNLAGSDTTVPIPASSEPSPPAVPLAAETAQAPPAGPPPRPAPRRRRVFALVAVGAAVLVLLGVVAAVRLSGDTTELRATRTAPTTDVTATGSARVAPKPAVGPSLSGQPGRAKASPTRRRASPSPSPTPAAKQSVAPPAPRRGVTFAGSTAAPTITVTGDEFGERPAGIPWNATVCGFYSDNGSNYGASLWFDDPGNFTAGNGTCIGIKIVTWTPTRVVFRFGNAYNTFGRWYVRGGDSYVVQIAGQSFAGTVAFG